MLLLFFSYTNSAKLRVEKLYFFRFLVVSVYSKKDEKNKKNI